MKRIFDIPEEKRNLLAKLLKEKREEKGFGMNQLSIKIGVNIADIHKIENSQKKKINPYQLKLLGKGLGIDYKELYKIVGYLDEKDLPPKGNAQIVSAGEEVLIPVYGDISAGNGKIIYGDIVGEYAVSGDTRNIDELIAVRVAGNSMEHRIPDKSYVLIRKDIEVESGEIGAFCLGEECFVKVLKIYGGTPVLRSLNPSYEDIEVTEDDEFFAIGKIIECKIKF